MKPFFSKKSKIKSPVSLSGLYRRKSSVIIDVLSLVETIVGSFVYEP